MADDASTESSKTADEADSSTKTDSQNGDQSAHTAAAQGTKSTKKTQESAGQETKKNAEQNTKEKTGKETKESKQTKKEEDEKTGEKKAAEAATTHEGLDQPANHESGSTAKEKAAIKRKQAEEDDAASADASFNDYMKQEDSQDQQGDEAYEDSANALAGAIGWNRKEVETKADNAVKSLTQAIGGKRVVGTLKAMLGGLR